MWLIVFSLAPCTVKEALFSSAGLDYSKPLNKSQTTTPGQQCQYIALSKSSTRAYLKTQPAGKRSFDHLAGKPYAEAARENDRFTGHNYPLGNSPPRYILYKRLKLDVA